MNILTMSQYNFVSESIAIILKGMLDVLLLLDDHVGNRLCLNL